MPAPKSITFKHSEKFFLGIIIYRKNINKNWQEHSFIYNNIKKDMSFDEDHEDRGEAGTQFESVSKKKSLRNK